MMSKKPRPCEKQCKGPCGRWLHCSRFPSRKRKRPDGTVWLHFDPVCKACQQIERNEKKNLDRPKAIIEQRARAAGRRLGKSFDFMWINMGYRSLVPIYRAMMSAEGECNNCGHPFLNEREIQIEHR